MENEAVISNVLAGTKQLERSGKPVWQFTLLSLFISLGILSYSYLNTVIETVSVWNASSHYRAGWLVLPTITLLLFLSRKDFRLITPTINWYGILFGLFFLVLWIASDLINISVLRQLTLLGIIGSLVLTAVGWPLFRLLFPYLALLLLAVPIWEILLPGLKFIAVLFVRTYTKIAGIPLTTDDFALFVGSNRYVIIDYCAGLSYVLVGLLIGASYALLSYRSYFRIALISLASGCIAILANGIRISSIISFEYFTGIDLDNYHYLFDLPVVIPCFIALLYFLSKLKAESLDHSDLSQCGKKRLSSFNAFLLVIGAAALFSIGPLYTQSIELSYKHQSSLPLEEKIGGWTQLEKNVDWHPNIESDGIGEKVEIYSLENTEILIYVAEPHRSDVKISGQAVNLGDKNWMNYSLPHNEKFCKNETCHSYGYLSSTLKNSKRSRHIYFGYIVDGMMTSSTLNFRIHRALANITGKGSSARYIAVVFEGKEELSKSILLPIFHHMASLE
jgi:exosortase